MAHLKCTIQLDQQGGECTHKTHIQNILSRFVFDLSAKLSAVARIKWLALRGGVLSKKSRNNWKIKCLDILIDILVCELVRSCFENSFELQHDNENMQEFATTMET